MLSFYEAAVEGDVYGVSEHFADWDVNIDTQFENGNTALFAAAQRGHNNVVDYLLGEGANIHIVNRNGHTALSIAAEKGHGDTLKKLLFYSSIDDVQAEVPVARAGGMTLLGIACMNMKSDVVKVLVESGADVNMAGSANGYTPVICAVRTGDSRSLCELLLANADPNLPDSSGVTPMIHACSVGLEKGIKALLWMGANPIIPGPTGALPIQYAMAHRNVRIVNLLIDNGADPRSTKEDVERASRKLSAMRQMITAKGAF